MSFCFFLSLLTPDCCRPLEPSVYGMIAITLYGVLTRLHYKYTLKSWECLRLKFGGDIQQRLVTFSPYCITFRGADKTTFEKKIVITQLFQTEGFVEKKRNLLNEAHENLSYRFSLNHSMMGCLKDYIKHEYDQFNG